MKKTKFLSIGFTLLFTIFVLTILMGGLTLIFARETAFAEVDLPSFSIYQGETKLDQKNDEYFVFGNSDSIELRFDDVIDGTLGLSVSVNGNAVELNADKNGVTLPILSGINNVILSYTQSGKAITKNLVVSVGWTNSAYEGIYYLPLENEWHTLDVDGIQGFVSQENDRLTASSMRLITKNVEYLSFIAQCYDASSNRKQVCGTISNADSSFNILGTSSSGAFVLNYAFDVVTINYNPQTSGKSETARLQINSLSTEVETVTLDCTFDSTLGEIYYFNSRGEKTNLSETNNVPKYLATDFYFQPYNNGNLTKIFAYNFTSGYLTDNATFDDGVDAYNVKLRFIDEASLNVDFKQVLVIPQNYTEIILRKGGYTSKMSIENGGSLELDYTEKVDIALSAPALKSGEKCDFYVDGELILQNIKESNGVYIYAFGELDQDHTFTFLYSKEGNYKSVEFTYTLKLISNNTIEQDILLTDNITVTNDSVYPFKYYSPVSTENVSYVAGNKGVMSTCSKISFTVTESGLFTFRYYMDISEASYCLLSVDEELNINDVSDYNTLVQNYGIGDAYGDFDKQSANHGNHGWRTKEIELNVTGSQTIYVYYIKVLPYDSFTDATSDTLAISGVAHYVGNAVVNTEVRFVESGNFTAVTEGVNVESGSTLKVGSQIELNATPNEGYIFYGWIINDNLVSTDANYSFVLIGDTVIEAVMQKPEYYVAKDLFNFYTSLKEAVLARDVERKITIINDEVITESLTIPNNIEILIPFGATDNTGFALGNTSIGGQNVSWANESKYLYLTLTVQEGVTLTVQGRFTLGAVQHYPDQSAQGHTSGAYSQIVNNGTIVLNDNGYLNVMGLIKGTGNIIANENTVIRMPFLVNNYSGGTITLAYYEANCFPFYNYSLVNIQCDYTINHKAKLIGSTSLYFFGSITTQDIVVVNAVEERIEDGDGSLYWLSPNSSIDFSYAHKSVNVVMQGAHLEDSGVTTLGINGEVVLGEFYLQGFGSNKMVLGLPYTLNFVINNGAKLVVPVDREYMLLPGSIMTVAENGTLEILGGFYVLEGLLQATMAGKQYPTMDMLYNSEFDTTGMLINNGTINIVGSFAGIVQSAVDGATIQTSATANLTKVLDLGTESGNNNKVGLTLVAKISGLRAGELTNIEKGQTYQSYSLASGTEFVLPSFTMDYATGVEPTILVNQTMHGSFAKVVNGKLIVYRKLDISSETSGVKINVNGVNYITDPKGQIEVETEINRPIAYLSPELDKINRSVNVWDSLSVITISIPQSIEITADSVFERVEASDGSITRDISVSGIVHFFDGTTQNIVLNAIALSDSYVQSAEFESESYKCNFTENVYIQKAELTKYIEDLNTLKTCTSDNLLSTVQSLYASYATITNGLQSEQTSYVKEKISALGGELDSYKQIISVLYPSNVTYGDMTVTASATTIDGKNVVVDMQNKGDYSIVNGNIQATFVYNSNFVVEGVLNIPYTVESVYSGIFQKELTVTIDDKTSVYGENLVELTANTDGLLSGDSKEDIFGLIKANGDNVGSYVITAEKTDKAISSYYKLIVTNGTYTITAKEITVTVSAKNVMLSKANTTVDITEELSDGVIIPIGYNIIKNGEKVATAINGAVTLVGENNITVGDYSVKPTTDNLNYSLTQTGDNLYSVVENKDYYTFDLGLTELSKEYDGEEVVVTPTVRNAETGIIVASIVKVNGSDIQIKYANTYNITVEVEGYTYSAVYQINPKTISVNWISAVATYDGTAKTPEIELSGVLSGESVSYEFDIQPINAGDYNVTVSVSNTNYTLDETKTHSFKINPKDVVLTVNEPSDMMISSIKNGELVIFTSTASESIAKENIYYEVYNASNELVFKVVNGVITVLGEITPNEYAVKAICTDSNYNATSVDSNLRIVEDNNYYTIDITFDSENNYKEYDGEAVRITTTVSITESGEIVDNSKVAVSLLVNGELIGEIKNAADYIVKVVIDNETEYQYTYKVNPRVLSLRYEVGELVYTGLEQKPTVYAENTVSGDEINLVLGDFECIEQGEKTAFVKEIGGASSHNYTLPKDNSFKYTINAKPSEIELSVSNALLNKVEQTLSMSFTNSELSKEDVRYIILNGVEEIGTVDSGVVQTTTPLTEGTYTLKAVSKNHNFVITTEAVPFEVVSSESYYTVSLGVDSLTKIYDGKEVVFNVSAVVTQSGKAVDFTFTVNSNTEYQVKNAAKYNLSVNISGVSFDYVYTITKREVEIEWSKDEFIYNGKKQLPSCLIKNKIEGDDAFVSLAEEESVTAGNKQIIANSLIGADSGNYSITEQTFKYTIKPMAITVTVSDTFSYYGDADSEILLTVKEDLPNVDTLKSIASATRERGITAGAYAITVTCISNNYTITANAATYTIKPKPITIRIDGKTSVYGEDLLPLTATTDDQTAFNDKIDEIYTLEKEVSVQKGEYEIRGICTNSNYDINFVNAVYTVTPREIEFNIPDFEVVYGEEAVEIVPTIPDNYSYAYDDNFDDIITIEREQGNVVGIYNVTATPCGNENYKINRISYTSADSSTYTITARPITMTLNDKTAENGYSYDEVVELITNNGYSITEGSIVEGDRIDIEIVVKFANGNVIMTAENFDDYFIAGSHTISIIATHTCYEITVVDATLTVTKPKLTVINMCTEYTYNDGEPITVFDWTKNIEGNLKGANENSFSVEITDTNGNSVEQIVNSGVYNVKVVIIHQYAFEFNSDAVTDYIVTVNKKDISDKITPINLPENGVTEYDPYASSVFAECAINGIDLEVNCETTCSEDNGDVGMFTLEATIDDHNYSGTKTFTWEVVAIDLSELFACVGFTDNGVYVLGDNLDIKFELPSKYKNIEVSYTLTHDIEGEVQTLSKVGEYIVKPKISDTVHYKFDVAFNINIIANYDEIFTAINEKLENIDSSDKWATVDEIREKLKGIAVTDRENVKKVSRYNEVLSQAEYLLSGLLEEIENVANTAKHRQNAQKVMEILNAITILAYFGIKQTL